jgi:hypothetical protein
VYALGDEGGLVLCTWPAGGRERFPFPYSDEVWTGVEYQVAAHLVYEGFVAEGLAIVQAARGRHDGVRRNPWNEFECGDHYARAMSSWSLLLALSGQRYDGRRRILTIGPALAGDDFRCLFTAGEGYGVFRRRRAKDGLVVEVECLAGLVPLAGLELLPGGARGPAPRLPSTGPGVACRMNRSPIPARAARLDGGVAVSFARAVTLRAGDVLTCRVK